MSHNILENPNVYQSKEKALNEISQRSKGMNVRQAVTDFCTGLTCSDFISVLSPSQLEFVATIVPVLTSLTSSPTEDSFQLYKRSKVKNFFDVIGMTLDTLLKMHLIRYIGIANLGG